MWDVHLHERTLNLSSERDKEMLYAFLSCQGLSMDRDIEYSVVFTDSEKIVASGSFAQRVLKCIAVDEEYKGMGLSAKVVSNLVNEQYRRGRRHLFIYIRPANRQVFSELGFYTIAEVPGRVVLMENRPEGLKSYLEELIAESGPIVPSAAVVVNCNPFTKGHLYLLEYAAARCSRLHVFVVWEDRSDFPAQTRYRLVKEGVAHLPKVIVHKGRDYIISNATFPSYFIKKYENVVETHARLDLTIFARHIAGALDIRKRFVGEEPYCPTTSAYNNIMKEMLPTEGIKVEEIPRLSDKDGAISASRVREMLRQGDLETVRHLVPETTWNFLLSSQGNDIIRKIRQ